MKRDAGFTLVEVMVSMLIGTIGLLGTIAVQQAITSASKSANDAAVAMRLATQKIEEFSAKDTDNPTVDARVGLGLASIATGVWFPLDGTNSVPQYLDAQGNSLSNDLVPRAPVTSAEIALFRWQRQWRVVNTGINGLPYVISVIVTYANDVGAPKTIRLDVERRKSW